MRLSIIILFCIFMVVVNSATTKLTTRRIVTNGSRLTTKAPARKSAYAYLRSIRGKSSCSGGICPFWERHGRSFAALRCYSQQYRECVCLHRMCFSSCLFTRKVCNEEMVTCLRQICPRCMPASSLPMCQIYDSMATQVAEALSVFACYPCCPVNMNSPMNSTNQQGMMTTTPVATPGGSPVNAGSNSGSAGGNTGNAAGGNTGNAAAGNTGNAAAGNTGNAAGGNTGNAAAGNTGIAAGGNTGNAAAGNTGNAAATNAGNAAATNAGNAAGGNAGNAAAGNTGNAAAGNTGNAAAANVGNAAAGNTGNAAAGNTGNAAAGNTGGNGGGNTGINAGGNAGVVSGSNAGGNQGTANAGNNPVPGVFPGSGGMLGPNANAGNALGQNQRVQPKVTTIRSRVVTTRRTTKTTARRSVTNRLTTQIPKKATTNKRTKN